LGIINFKNLFSRFREVLDAYIPNKLRRKSLGKYDFIKFTDIKECMKATKQMSGKIVGDCKLQVT